MYRRLRMATRQVQVATQRLSLETLAQCVQDDITNEAIYTAARQITAGCDERDDMCELHAIFDAVRNGTDKVKGMSRGVRYVSDPSTKDFFVRPRKMLEQCAIGACAEDCDSHAALIAALCGSLGFRVGVRGYGPKKDGPLTHVYAVVITPKIAQDEFGNFGSEATVRGMDTTVKGASVGWQPPPGKAVTAWILPEGVRVVNGNQK